MKVAIRLSFATLTFGLGVLAWTAAQLPLNLIVSLGCFFGTPLIISSIVLYQGGCLKKEWRPAIGKGFLASFLWLFPSVIVVTANLFVTLEGSNQQTAPNVILSILNIGYGAAGLVLCRWVKNYEVENHWMLNNRQ